MRVFLEKIIKSNLFKGSIILTASNFIANLLNYIFNFLVGRTLGPSGYGEITALFSYITILSIPISIFSTILIQKIGEHEGDKISYAHAIEEWFIRKIKRWWFLVIPFIFIIPFVPRITNLSPIVAYSLIPLIILILLSIFYDAAFQGLQLFMWFSIITTVSVFVKLLGGLFTALGFNTSNIIIVFLIASALVKLFMSRNYFIKIYKNHSVTTSYHFDQRIQTILRDKHIWITIVTLISLTLLNNFDIIFVKKFFDAEQSGIYASWSLFAKIILYLVGPLVSIAFIFFTSSEHQQYHKKAFIGSFMGILITGISSYLFYHFFGAWMIHVLFGNQFQAVVPFLSSASIFGILYVMIIYLNNFFVAKKSIAALVLPIGLPFYISALFLIPKNITSIINTNLIFSLIIIVTALFAYTISVIYNNLNGKETKASFSELNNTSIPSREDHFTKPSSN